MITREVREWLDKVKRREYSYDDALYEFQNFIPWLTKEEAILIKKRIEESYN